MGGRESMKTERPAGTCVRTVMVRGRVPRCITVKPETQDDAVHRGNRRGLA
jgi:hypothetical protein